MDSRPAAAPGRLGTAAALRRALALGVVLLVVSQLLLARSARLQLASAAPLLTWTAALWRAAAGGAGGDADYDPDAGAPIDAASWAAALAGGGVGVVGEGVGDGGGGDVDVPLDVDEAPPPAPASPAAGGGEPNSTAAAASASTAPRDDPLSAMLDLIENRLARPEGGGAAGGGDTDDEGEDGDEDEEGAAAAGDAEGDDYSTTKSGSTAAAAVPAPAAALAGAAAAAAAAAPAAPPPPVVVPIGDMAAPDAKLLRSTDPEDDDVARPPDEVDEPAAPSRAPRGPAASRTPTPSAPTRRSLAEGHTLWRSRYPPPAWLPPSQAHHRACRLENQYLHLVTSRGGFGSLYALVREAMALAKALGRTFVEPCVRGGAIVPCWPGRVASLPASAADAAAAAAAGAGVNITADLDPLAVPAFAEACAGSGDAAAGAPAAPMPVKQLLKQLASRVIVPTAAAAAASVAGGDDGTPVAKKSPRPTPSPAVEVWRQPAQGRAYPLRLYFDVAALARAHYPRVVTFDEWLACAMKRKKRRPGLIDTYVSRKAAGRVAADRAYCVTERGGPGRARVRDACHRVVGPYTFSSFWSPADAGGPVPPAGPDRDPFTGHMWRLYRDALKADRGANLYLTEVWAGTLMPRGGVTEKAAAGEGQSKEPAPMAAAVGQPPFNDIHRHALRAWLKAGAAVSGANSYRPRPKPPAAPPAKLKRPMFRFDDAGPGDKAAAGGGGGDGLLLPGLGGSAFAAFHWATTGVPEWKLPGCAQSLARRTAALTGWREWVAPPKARKKPGGGGAANGTSPSPLPPPPFHPWAVLLADVAAPSNPCASSAGAAGGGGSGGVDGAAALRRPSPARRKALEALLAGGGLRKYDADLPGLDAGVLAIREFLLARDARHYVTCHQPPVPAAEAVSGSLQDGGGGGGTGDGSGGADFECRACTRVESPYVGALVAVRRARGKAAITSWFTGRPDPAAA